jgi:FkbM family methyltransferase
MSPIHRIFLNLSLHALGHDNPRFTGESWFIKSILKKHDTRICIDVGAHIGNYSSELIESLGCTVYAVEPLSSSFEELEVLAKKYEGKLLPIHAALADQVSVGTIRTKGPRSEKATLARDGERYDIEEHISIITLDSLVRERSLKQVDFIKIDTEGFEREVLQGAQNTIASLKPKFIQFEFNINQLNQGYTVFDLSKLLPGYTLYRLLPHGWIRIDPNTFANNIFMFQNIVAVKS